MRLNIKVLFAGDPVKFVSDKHQDKRTYIKQSLFVSYAKDQEGILSVIYRELPTKLTLTKGDAFTITIGEGKDSVFANI